MARGRMINNAITKDKKVNDLSCDTSRLAFTWLVSWADKEGRVHGDPMMVRSMVFPRRDDVTLAQMTSYIQEWQAAGFIIWYEAEGDQWIQFVNFDKNQPGLRKDREPDSIIPPPPSADDGGKHPADIRQTSGKMTGEEKGREGKGIEGNIAADAPPSPLEPETDGQRLLFEKINRERSARGYSPITKFNSLACKQKFSEAEKRLQYVHLHLAIVRALEKGLLSAVKVTDFVAKWQGGGKARGSPSRRDLNADIETIMVAMGKNGRHNPPDFDDPFLKTMVSKLDWYRLGEVTEAAARSMVKNAWFEARQ